MIYTLDGVEIQYRECQILRDTAKEVMQGKEKAERLIYYKREWILQLECLARQNPLKRKYADSLAVALQRLPEDMFEAVSEYIEFLIQKGRGIDIMELFVAENLRTILPVNVHEGMGDAHVEK